MFWVKNCVPVFKKFQGLKIKGNIRMANNIKSFQKEDPEIVSSLKTYKNKVTQNGEKKQKQASLNEYTSENFNEEFN